MSLEMYCYHANYRGYVLKSEEFKLHGFKFSIQAKFINGWWNCVLGHRKNETNQCLYLWFTHFKYRCGLCHAMREKLLKLIDHLLQQDQRLVSRIIFQTETTLRQGLLTDVLVKGKCTSHIKVKSYSYNKTFSELKKIVQTNHKSGSCVPFYIVTSAI